MSMSLEDSPRRGSRTKPPTRYVSANLGTKNPLSLVRRLPELSGFNNLEPKTLVTGINSPLPRSLRDDVQSAKDGLHLEDGLCRVCH